VRGEFVPGAVAGQERHLVVADGTDGDRGARRPVRGVDGDVAGVGSEEGVEAAAADDSEHPTIVVHAAGVIAGAGPRD
jgi:hypothetical protein